MYSSQKTEPGVWAVGEFLADGSWRQESRWSTADEATEHAHLLNVKTSGEAEPPSAQI